MVTTDLFKVEEQTYQRHKPELLEKHRGEWALVYGEELQVFPTYPEATKAGLEQYGLDAPYMVAEIRKSEAVFIPLLWPHASVDFSS